MWFDISLHWTPNTNQQLQSLQRLQSRALKQIGCCKSPKSLKRSCKAATAATTSKQLWASAKLLTSVVSAWSEWSKPWSEELIGVRLRVAASASASKARSIWSAEEEMKSYPKLKEECRNTVLFLNYTQSCVNKPWLKIWQSNEGWRLLTVSTQCVQKWK